MNIQRHIRWFLSSILMLLLVACGDDQPQRQSAVLTIYVYTPDRPMVTRGEVGDISALDAEMRITSFKIWVFEHETGNLVAYQEPEAFSDVNDVAPTKFELPLPDWFTLAKPNVDVYVFANVTQSNCDLLKELDGSSTRDDLNSATIRSGAFGLNSLDKLVKLDDLKKDGFEGLPMTGILLDQPVDGEDPTILTVGSRTSMATAHLVRTTSKVHFVFGRPESAEESLRITGVELAAGSIPDEEYLVLFEPYKFRIKTSGYNTVSKSLLSSDLSITTSCEKPSEYVYDLSGAQDYETKIATAISESKLTGYGPFYLRESDKQLKGTIKYRVGTETEDRTASFEMETEGDFARNHSWIVYAYYTSDGMLDADAVSVDDWDNEDEEHRIPNW